MSRTQQLAAARSTLADRIRAARAVTLANDPNRIYRRNANLCRKGVLSYNALFGIGKAPKAAGPAPAWWGRAA